MAQLITGDAVTLDLRMAALPSRSLALAIDVTIQVGLLMAGTVLVAWAFGAGGSPGAQAALTLLVVVFALVVWPTIVETVTRGRSLGKAVMGLRVVRDDGGPIRMRHSLVRALAMVFIDLWITSGVVGGLSALISARSKRMGDHLAGTIVVGERIPRSATAGLQPIVMPPPLAAWAAGLDLVGVPDVLALNVRTFLHRAATLAPEARAATADQLAAQMAQHVRAPAPPGTPAEAYLAAILADRLGRPGSAATAELPAQRVRAAVVARWAAHPTPLSQATGPRTGPSPPGAPRPGSCTGEAGRPPRAGRRRPRAVGGPR